MSESYQELVQRELDETLADNATAETTQEWLERSHYDPRAPSPAEAQADLDEFGQMEPEIEL